MRTATRRVALRRALRGPRGAAHVVACAGDRDGLPPSRRPVPVNSFQRGRRGLARRAVITSATCSEASRGPTCQTSAASPRAIGAAKLVPWA